MMWAKLFVAFVLISSSSSCAGRAAKDAGGVQMATWDWEKQRAETAFVVDDIESKPDVFIGMKIRLEVQIVPGNKSDHGAFTADLSTNNIVHRIVTQQDGSPSEVKVVFDDAVFSFDSIWEREKRVTAIALKHGFVPDGWGFLTRPDVI